MKPASDSHLVAHALHEQQTGKYHAHLDRYDKVEDYC